MLFNDLLAVADVNPADMIVFRHRPREPALRKVLPWLAAERPELYNAYQQTHNGRAEGALSRAKMVASFIGHEPGKALFIGLYNVTGFQQLTYQEYWGVPVLAELKTLGMNGFRGDRPSILWFDLAISRTYAGWKGKLIVKWPPPERSWRRWADRNKIPVHAILEESLLDEAMPQWEKISLLWRELSVLPSKWRSKLSEWRGIYFILDISDGKGYVGSAYGAENILGRWLSYRVSGHGDNVQLRQRRPENLRFSILQRVSPDMDADEIIQLESTWKDRLGTRTHGLNDN